MAEAMRLERACCGLVEEGLEGGLKELPLGDPVLVTEEDRYREGQYWTTTLEWTAVARAMTYLCDSAG